MNEVRANYCWRGVTFGLPFPCYVASDPVWGTIAAKCPQHASACGADWNGLGVQLPVNSAAWSDVLSILAEGAIALSVTLSGGALFAS